MKYSLLRIQLWPLIARVTTHFIKTSSNGNIFCVTGTSCGEFTGPGEFPAQRLVTRSFDVFFDLRLNKWLRKQPLGWWFETPSWPLWRHCNVKPNCRRMFLLERGIGSAGVNQDEKLHAVVLNQKHVLYHQTNSFHISQNTRKYISNTIAIHFCSNIRMTL